MRIVELHQYSPEWWDLRRGVPTASAFHRILTPKGKLSAGSQAYICLLIAEKFDAYYSTGEEYQSAAMESGSLLEPRSKALYEWTNDCVLREVGFIFADGDRYGCSPDALVNEDGVLESKSPQPKTQIEYLLSGELPDKYRPQCHGHLVVTGRDFCDFQSFVPGFPSFNVRVVPDEYTANLKAALDEFCDRYATELAKVESRLKEFIELEIDRSIAQNETPTAHRSYVT